MLTNNELLVEILGNVSVTFNDYGSSTPDFLLTNTRLFLSGLTTRRSKTPRQAQHGVDDSISFDEDRVLNFEGKIFGTTQADRRAKEMRLMKCLSLRFVQSYADEDGYFLIKITDDDLTTFQAYAKIMQYPHFDIFDDTDPTISNFDFSMVMKDPVFYSQDLIESSGGETHLSSNFKVVNNVSMTVPFKLFMSTQATITCENLGNADSPPVLIIYGPTTNPTIENLQTGKILELTKGSGLELLTDERCEIDTLAGTVIKYDASDVASDASAYVSDDSDWIVLQSGSNDLLLEDDSGSTPSATLTVKYRYAYKT